MESQKEEGASALSLADSSADAPDVLGGVVLGAVVLAVSLSALLSVSALAESAPPSDPPPKWGPSIDIEGKAGTRRHLGEADLFLPLWQDDATLVFGNARFRADDARSREGNVGLGVRHMLADGWNVGAYGYFDRRRSPNDHMFNQVTFGAEALGRDFDARANLYLPFGERIKNVDALNTAQLSGTSVIFRGGEERAIPGFDAEIGWRAPVLTADGPYDLRLYAGGFRFDDPAVEAVAGPRLRAELTAYEVPYLWPGARLTVGAEWQHDDVRGSQGFGSVRLRIPLQVFAGGSAPTLSAQERRMTDPTVRDVDVVSQAGQFSAPETVTQLANGTTFSVISSSSTSGADLPGAVTAAGAGSTVILAGTFNTTAFTQVQNAQSLMAGAIGVRSASGRTATLNTPATISSTNATAVQLAGNNTLSGLTINTTWSGGTGGSAVVLNSTAGNINVLNSTITVAQTGANGAAGISLGSNTNVVVSGNTVTMTGSGGAAVLTGINIFGSTGVTVAGNTLNVSGGTTNRAINVSAGSAITTAASTGNAITAGTCTNAGTGTISFTDGTTCP